MPDALVPVSARSLKLSDRPRSAALAYDEIERLINRVEAWETRTLVLTGDAENLIRRIHGLDAGPRSPMRCVEDEMARVAQRIDHLEHRWRGEAWRGTPLLLRLRRGIRSRFRSSRTGNKAERLGV